MATPGPRGARMELALVSAVALALAAGCGGHGSGTSAPSASSTAGSQVRGTLTKGPGVMARLDGAPGESRTWLARMAERLLPEAEAVTTGSPAANVALHLDCTGANGSHLTTTTNAAGRFEFENVQGDTCSLTAIVQGSPIVVASNIRLGAVPAEIEGALTAPPPPAGAPGPAAPAIRKLKVETDVDDDDGHHQESHGDDNDDQGGKHQNNQS